MSAITPTANLRIERGPAARRQRQRFIRINVFGGLAVLGTYAWGFIAQPEVMGALWGGVPEVVRPLYTVNMYLAAAGYFLFTAYVLLKLSAGVLAESRVGLGLIHGLYGLVLLPSALWLPLTFWMLAAPSALLWWAICFDLALVGVGAVGLLVALISLGESAPKGRGWALLGLLPFCLQTAVLDAIVWPLYFPQSQ